MCKICDISSQDGIWRYILDTGDICRKGPGFHCIGIRFYGFRLCVNDPERKIEKVGTMLHHHIYDLLETIQ